MTENAVEESGEAAKMAAEEPPKQVDDAKMKVDEEDANDDASPEKKDDGYYGKYSWKGKQSTRVRPDDGILGETISDYSWSDGKKKVSVYVTLPGLDDACDDALSASLSSDKKGLKFEASLGNKKKRVLKIDPLNGGVSDATIVRKKGRNTVVIKLTKDPVKKWYAIKGYGGGGGSYDYDDDFDYGDAGEWDDDDEPLPEADSVDDDDRPAEEDAEAGALENEEDGNKDDSAADDMVVEEPAESKESESKEG